MKKYKDIVKETIIEGDNCKKDSLNQIEIQFRKDINNELKNYHIKLKNVKSNQFINNLAIVLHTVIIFINLFILIMNYNNLFTIIFSVFVIVIASFGLGMNNLIKINLTYDKKSIMFALKSFRLCLEKIENVKN